MPRLCGDERDKSMVDSPPNDMLNLEAIWRALEDVKDPEIPVISVIEMGIVRDVILNNNQVRVVMTPTFSGCPALHVMRQDIARRIKQLGYPEVSVEVRIYPPWRTDWITDEGRKKLKDFGVAPPSIQGDRQGVTFFELSTCPYCDSEKTTLKNNFGPTLCRSIYFCEACQQPFEQFKAL